MKHEIEIRKLQDKIRALQSRRNVTLMNQTGFQKLNRSSSSKGQRSRIKSNSVEHKNLRRSNFLPKP